MDSLAAAKELLAAGHWRSSVSRAYYAVYARVSHELFGVASFAEDRVGPEHIDLPDMLYDYLTRLSVTERVKCSRAVERMYEWRCMADYRPFLTVDEALAREAVMQCDVLFKVVEVAYD